MVNADRLRKLALALPEVEEKSHFGQPDFRVCAKIFASLSRDGLTACFKLPVELQGSLLDSRPEAFYAASGAWGRKGWTHLRLGQAKAADVQALLLEAWQLTAPKRLLKPAGNDRRPK